MALFRIMFTFCWNKTYFAIVAQFPSRAVTMCFYTANEKTIYVSGK